MEIEKTLTVAAPPQRVWAMLLDPQVMGGCVPGMQSIEVVSDVEYVALMHVKIAFISAKFRLRTTIVEQRAPEYLRAEGTGEDASVASSLKQQSEIFLTPTADGGTELRIKVQVDVLGRLGTFGLSVMKTKADRMWEEFGANLAARIDGDGAPSTKVAPTAAQAPAPDALRTPAGAPARAAPAAVLATAPSLSPSPSPASASAAVPTAAGARTAAAASEATAVPVAAPAAPAARPAAEAIEPQAESGWWSRLLGGKSVRSAGPVAAPGRFIRIEVRQLDKTISVEWPVEGAEQCQSWLRELMR